MSAHDASTGPQVFVDGDAFSSDGVAGGLDWSHTTGDGVGVLGVAVGYHRDIETSIIAVSYGQLALTPIRSDPPAGLLRTELWYFSDPPPGTTQINVDMADAPQGIVGASVSFGGANAEPGADTGAFGSDAMPALEIGSSESDLVLAVAQRRSALSRVSAES